LRSGEVSFSIDAVSVFIILSPLKEWELTHPAR